MSTDIPILPPLPDPEHVAWVDDGFNSGTYRTGAFSAYQMQDYAASACAPLRAKIERLTAALAAAEADARRRHELLKLQHAESVELWNALKDLSFECDGVTRTEAPSRETYNRTFGLLQRKRHLSPEALRGHGEAGFQTIDSAQKEKP